MLYLAKRLLGIATIGLIIAINTSCKEDPFDPPEPQQSLVDTKWQFMGYFDTETNVIEEPDNSGQNSAPQPYTLYFEEEYLYAVSKSNLHWGKYEADYISFAIQFALGSTLAGELAGGVLYAKILKSQVQSFSFKNDTLKLFYNDKKNYLLYNKTDYDCREMWQ